MAGNSPQMIAKRWKLSQIDPKFDTKIDTKTIQILEEEVKNILFKGQQPSSWSVLCLASFKALHEYEWCHLLKVTAEIEEVVIRQVNEQRIESALKADIPTLDKITNKTNSP